MWFVIFQVFFSFPFVSQVKGDLDQHLSILLSHPQFSCSFLVSFVRAKCISFERKNLWSALLHDKLCNEPWYIVGDFNFILSLSEKKGGRPCHPSEGLELSNFMSEAGVFYADFSGSNFT